MNETLERIGLSFSLRSPKFFRHVVRPELYKRCMKPDGTTDPEDVHKIAVEMANRYATVFEANQNLFNFPELAVQIRNLQMQPFGTAAGMDKNGDALIPFSYVFGFQTIGTVIVDGREGNDQPRVAVDDKMEDAYNAQGFPSKGKDYVVNNLQRYRRSNAPQKPIIASVCGLPHVIREQGAASFVPSKNRVVTERSNGVIVYKEFADIPETETEKALHNAYVDTEILLHDLDTYVDGFEWNPYSPNTATLTLLRNPETFTQYSKLLRERAGSKLVLVKMGPYDDKDKDKWLRLVEGFARYGDGITCVNTYMVPKDQVPSAEWGYPSAGRSGRFLKDNRVKAVEDARAAFPEIKIFATGGISSGPEAYETFGAGADAIEGYTPFTYHGLGLARTLMKGVKKGLANNKYRGLHELISDAHQSAQPF